MVWAAALPWIAKALAGPLASIAVDLVKEKVPALGETAEQIKNSLSGLPPEEIVELKRIDYELQTKLAALGYDHLEKLELYNLQAFQAAIQHVNATMQVESKAEHWPTYSWRPFIGFVFGISFLFVSLLCCYLAYMAVVERVPDAIGMISSLVGSMTGLFAIPGAILGVTAWYRGRMQSGSVAGAR